MSRPNDLTLSQRYNKNTLTWPTVQPFLDPHCLCDTWQINGIGASFMKGVKIDLEKSRGIAWWSPDGILTSGRQMIWCCIENFLWDSKDWTCAICFFLWVSLFSFFFLPQSIAANVSFSNRILWEDTTSQSSLSPSSFQPVTSYERLNENWERKQKRALWKQSSPTKGPSFSWDLERFVAVWRRQGGNRLLPAMEGVIAA